MADEAVPLTDEERSELEELRAEKARRERAELEELRAEARFATPRPSKGTDDKAPAASASRAAASVAWSNADEDRRIAAAKERGRKLMEPDDDLSMPVGQKIVLACVAVAVIVVIAMFVLMPR